MTTKAFSAEFFRNYETPSGRSFEAALVDLEERLNDQLKRGWKETQSDERIQLNFVSPHSTASATFPASPLFQDLMEYKLRFELFFLDNGWGTVLIEKKKEDRREAVVTILLKLAKPVTLGDR